MKAVFSPVTDGFSLLDRAGKENSSRGQPPTFVRGETSY
jgi:hypothetical protein